MRLFDTHAHYDSGAFNADRKEVLSSMPDRGVELILNPGCELESSQTAVELAERFPFVYAAVGVHPSDCGDWEDGTLLKLRQLASHPTVRAIGEIGLDYHYEDVPRRQQLLAFEQQLELAQELDLPVVIHEREAHGDCLDVLRNHPKARGVFHCFSGSWEMAKKLTDQGWYLGFTGVITFKNSRRAPEVVRWVPADRIMIETDAPYLAPEPRRGRRNDSSLLPYITQAVAAFRGISEEEAARITWENGLHFFDIQE